jgi:transposase
LVQVPTQYPTFFSSHTTATATRDVKAPHVAREQWTVKFEPVVTDKLESIVDEVAKVVGVSDDLEGVAKCEKDVQQASCWRRLRDWQEAGIWQLIHFSLLDWLARFGEIDWSRAVVDGSSIRAVWGLQTGPNPTDRAKLGSKRHLICDGRVVPLAIQLTRANRNDSQQALALIDAIPSLQGERGRPRHRHDSVLGDRGYDAEAIRQGLRDRRIIPFLAKRNTEHGSGLGPWRWVVERTSLG